MKATLQHRAQDLLSDAIAEVMPTDGGLVLRDGRRVALQVKSLRQARVEELIGSLATAVLQLRASQRADSIPVALVHVPKFGRRSASRVRDFMEEYVPEVGWGLFDDVGGSLLVVPVLEIDEFRSGRRRPSPTASAPRRLFTDLQRWLLKHLLLRKAPPANFPATSDQRPLNPSEWSERAQVSHQTAYTLAGELEKRGLLIQGPEGLELPDPRRLLDEWLHEDALYPAPRVWVRDVLRGRALDEIFEGAPVAVGGLEAASRLGMLHVARVGVPEVHVRGPLDPLLSKRGLVQVERRDADVGLIRSPYVESVFRGAQALDRTPLVDVLQAALDVVGSRGRGREQAEFLIERIVEWQ